MKNTFTRFMMAAALLFCCQFAFAQNATMSPTRLPLVEQEMYNKGNLNFIVVDLLIDGLMQPGDNCQFLYKKGKITFQGNKLPAAVAQKYQLRLKDFFAAQGLNSDGIYAVALQHVTMDDVLNPASSFRTATQSTGTGQTTKYNFPNSKF